MEQTKLGIKRLTWDEIEAKYPNQLVGLIDAKYMGENIVSIESAVVKYTEQDISYDELVEKATAGEIILEHTNIENGFLTDITTVLLK